MVRAVKAEQVPEECCATPGRSMLGQAEADSLARTFAALADPVRLRLLSLVAGCDTGEICACDLADPVGRSQPTISHHMKVLHEAGLVEREKRGLWVWYRTTPRGTALMRLAGTADA